jgi:hypothetical protein
MGWFVKKKPVKSDVQSFAEYARTVPLGRKGYQVGDKVVVVRFADDDTDDSEFEHVYGRIGTIAAVIQDHHDTVYDYTVEFPGWSGGWLDGDDSGLEYGPHWGVYNRNLRRVVSKSEKFPA